MPYASAPQRERLPFDYFVVGARRRAGLKYLLAGMLMGSAGVALVPQSAIAGCAPDPSPHFGATSATVETCTGINTGVTYRDATSDLTLDLTNATITTDGVLVANLIGPGNTTISISTGAVTATGTLVNGIEADSIIGNISVTTNGAVTTPYQGIVAVTGGTATVHTKSTVTSTGVGVASAIAVNASQGVTIITDAPVSNPSDDVIYAYSASGPVSITTNGVSNGSILAIAVSPAKSVSVNVNADVSGGVAVLSFGGGTINISNNATVKRGGVPFGSAVIAMSAQQGLITLLLEPDRVP